MQSSSGGGGGGGGDNEFGSFLDSVPAFLNPPTLFEPSSSSSQVPFPSSSSMAMLPKPNPRKRTRASRKAPTTVLTTDPVNFKAMVQEFTGIPAPPFSTSSSSSRRLDLFGSGSVGIRSSHLEPATTTPLLNNIPLVEASNMLNLQTQMVQPDGLVGLKAGIYGNDDHKRLKGSSFKLDYSVSSSDFHHENVASNSFSISPAE
ncbi:hypothetical protein GQ457_07G020610 [Hibiscus cannabinus]